RRDRFRPGESLAKHHGFAGEHDRGALTIDRFVDATYAISRSINGVLESPSGDGAAAGAARREYPPELRIILPPRFFLTDQPFGRLRMNPPKRKFAACDRERGRQDNLQRH